jgi:glycosyltransferase involved in cell wall biosynthesis
MTESPVKSTVRTSSGTPPISVTATVLNEFDDIDGLVSTLAEQVPTPKEVIVVDGGSTDGTWERLQAARSKYSNLIAIRDESCNLKASAGPIARGRNVGIRAATSEIVACADAGCIYDPEWLARLTAPIVSGKADYALGGSCIDPQDQTIWDIASAPFFGLKQRADGTTKSCTARSMAFRKSLWQRVGGFPETSFLGEDTMFDLLVRKVTMPAYAERAQAMYRPRHTLKSALSMMARYGVADGVLGTRRSRLVRNFVRCVAEVIALALIPISVIPLIAVLLLEIYFAFRLDWSSFRQRATLAQMGARLWYSLLVPWVAAWNQAVGELTKTNQPNRQNA